MEKRIKWIEPDLKERKAHAYNDKQEYLGWLNYEKVGAHMHWCWYQNKDIRMSPGCLQEVRDKQKELYSQRKLNWKDFVHDGTKCAGCKHETRCRKTYDGYDGLTCLWYEK